MPYSFAPSNADTLLSLKHYVENALREISNDSDRQTLVVPKYYRQPTELDSMLFYVPAEATWNPGSGTGLYYFDGTTYIKVV